MASADPTKTLTLRKLFASQINARFSYIIKLIRQSIVENDCFGLINFQGVNYLFAKVNPPSIRWKDSISPIGRKRFELNSDSEKAELFLEWLERALNSALLQPMASTNSGPFLSTNLGSNLNAIWSDIYIEAAYRQGIAFARKEVKKQVDLSELRDEQGLSSTDIAVLSTAGIAISRAFSRPEHYERAKALFVRTFEEMQNLSQNQRTALSRILTEGLIKDSHPRVIASEIARSVRETSKKKAMMIARTEIIRAHHLGTIQEYRNLGVVDLEVEAEFNTAHDNKVCQICKDKDGKIYTLDEAEFIIPVHPNCRCAMLPYFGEESVKRRQQYSKVS